MEEFKELFDRKFIHLVWDNSLQNKKAFVANDLDALRKAFKEYLPTGNSNEKPTDLSVRIFYSHSDEFPFASTASYHNYAFAYYDPNLDCKIAHKQGKTIEFRLKGSKERWETLGSASSPSWGKEYEYRLRPNNAQKLIDYWLSQNPHVPKNAYPLIWLKNDNAVYLITAYRDNNEVCLGRDWFSVETLKKYFTFLDGTPVAEVLKESEEDDE